MEASGASTCMWQGMSSRSDLNPVWVACEDVIGAVVPEWFYVASAGDAHPQLMHRPLSILASYERFKLWTCIVFFWFAHHAVTGSVSTCSKWREALVQKQNQSSNDFLPESDSEASHACTLRWWILTNPLRWAWCIRHGHQEWCKTSNDFFVMITRLWQTFMMLLALLSLRAWCK